MSGRGKKKIPGDYKNMSLDSKKNDKMSKKDIQNILTMLSKLEQNNKAQTIHIIKLDNHIKELQNIISPLKLRHNIIVLNQNIIKKAYPDIKLNNSVYLTQFYTDKGNKSNK